jgi:hypothetical protein
VADTVGGTDPVGGVPVYNASGLRNESDPHPARANAEITTAASPRARTEARESVVMAGV